MIKQIIFQLKIVFKDLKKYVKKSTKNNRIYYR